MSAAEQELLCGRFRRRDPGLGHQAPPLLRPFDPLLPVVDEITGREAWLLPISATFVGSEVDRSYFIMGANQAATLSCQRAIAPAFVDRDEHWFWIGYWKEDLENHPYPEGQNEACIAQWALGVAKNLEELHVLGKQHGLLQPGAVVRSADGTIRVWGGALHELLSRLRLAVKTKQDAAAYEVLYVPAVLQGAPLTLKDELAGWAMTVASRWFNASGRKALLRLEQELALDAGTGDLARLLTQCLEDPQGQGIHSAKDLVTRLEVLCDRVEHSSASPLERGVHDFGTFEGSMPSLENIDLRSGNHQGLLTGRPVTSANGPVAAANADQRNRRSTRRSTVGNLSGPDAGNWNPPPEQSLRGSGKRLHRWLLWFMAADLVIVGAVALAWWAGFIPPSLLPFASSSSEPELAEESSNEASPEQAPALAGDGPCPDRAARLPEGGCMDRFEYPGEGEKPRVSITKNQAELLCKARQGRLCAKREWRSACALGKANLKGCQLRDGRKDASTLREASKSDCVHAGTFYDLIGNAAEWVLDGSALGGDAKTLRAKAGCSKRLSSKRAKSGAFSVGFRCCYGPLPQDDAAPQETEAPPESKGG